MISGFWFIAEGVWSCYVTMATEDKLDSSQADFDGACDLHLVVYGSKKSSGPIQLTDGKDTKLELGTTHTFKVGNKSCISFIKYQTV